MYVSILDENKEEQIRITFNKITLGTERKADDYAVELNNKELDPVKEEDSEDDTGLETYYPTINWQGVTLGIEESVKTENGTRSFMTFTGEKEFTIVQERAVRSNHKLPVSMEGDPVDLGFTVAAITDKSLRWESDGISFFIASETLTKDELIEVALSMSAGEMK